MHYTNGIKSLEKAAISEAIEWGHKYIYGLQYSECCTNAVGRSRFETAATMTEAVSGASDFLTGYSWGSDEEEETAQADLEREIIVSRSARVHCGDFDVMIYQVSLLAEVHGVDL